MATTAKLIEFFAAGLSTSTGAPYSGYQVRSYAADGTTAKAVWRDRAKTQPSTAGESSFTLDATGRAKRYGDGIYVYKVWTDTADPDVDSPVDTFGPMSVEESISTGSVVQTVATIAALRSLTATPGDSAQCLGYYSANDGGGGPVRRYYALAAPGTYTDNGGSVIVPTGGDGSAAWRWTESSVPNVLCWGLKGDSVTSDSSRLQAMLDAGEKRISFQGGKTYAIAGTIYVPVGARFDGVRGSRVMPISGGMWVGNTMFYLNSNDGADWVESYPNHNSGGFTNVDFWNEGSPIADIIAIKSFCGSQIEQCRFFSFEQSIVRPSGFFLDSFVVRHCFFTHPLSNTAYQVDIQGLGDGLTITDLHFPFDTTAEPDESILGLRIRGCNGGTVDNIIGGDHVFEQSTMSARGWHIEHGQVECNASNITFISSNFYPDTRVPIKARNTFANTFLERCTLKLIGVHFVWVEQLEGFMYDGPMVQIDDKVSLEVDGSYRRWTANAALHRCQLSGFKVQNVITDTETTSDNTTWNAYSYLLSTRGRIGANYLVQLMNSVAAATSSYPGIDPTHPGTSGTGRIDVTGLADQWIAATGTYYYTSQIIYDPIRIVGRNQTSAEMSIIVADTSKLSLIVIDHSATRNRSSNLRIYRGTSTGSYNQYVDIHNIDSAYFFDNGDYVNGVAWQSRAAGGVDTINSSSGDMRWHGATATFELNIIPTTGTWTDGDTVNRYDSTVDTGNMLLIGHKRLTTGSGHTLGTDWANMRTSTATSLAGSATYDPPNITDGTGATTTVTVTGAALGDYATASFSLDLQGIVVTAYVSATNTVSVRFQNETGGDLDIGSGTLRARVIKVS